jgi:hypothetical protein
LRIEDKKDNCITKATLADSPLPDGFMEQWIAINLAFGSDEVVRHFMGLKSVKEWFAKKRLRLKI